MAVADPLTYLGPVCEILRAQWPQNRTVNVVCHGHSVPAGYFATPVVDSFAAYPHLLHRQLRDRFPFAVVNVIVTAIGGESSARGAERFEREVLCHRPDVLTIDYGLNDRGLGLDKAREAWMSMIRGGLAAGAKVLLLTPTPDLGQRAGAPPEPRRQLQEHAAQIRQLADDLGVGLVDSLREFELAARDGDLTDYLSWINHPNRAGHELVARALLRWFPALTLYPGQQAARK